MAANELHALARAQIGDLGKLLPASRPELSIRLIEPLHILSMRMLPGGADAVADVTAVVGIPLLPSTGRFTGEDPLILWRNPTELLFVASRAAVAESVLRELPPGSEALAYAVEQSDGLIVFELEGAALDDVLSRLLDAAAVPLESGHATRARMAEIAVIAIRLGPQRAWLLADRANDRYLAQWVAYAADALASI